MLKKIVPSLAVLGALAAPAAAADGPYVGFEFGFDFQMFNDDRVEGAAGTFALTFPVGSNLSISIVHERGNITVEENAVTEEGNTEGNKIQVNYNVWQNDTQAVGLYLGFGNMRYDFDGAPIADDTALLADLGAKYVPVSAKTGPVKGQIDVHAAYRYAKISPVTPAGMGDVFDDLGGFVIGLGAGIFF